MEITDTLEAQRWLIENSPEILYRIKKQDWEYVDYVLLKEQFVDGQFMGCHMQENKWFSHAAGDSIFNKVYPGQYYISAKQWEARQKQMKSVYKYSIPISDRFVLTLPRGAKILSIQIQNGEPEMWALVNPEASTEDRKFRLVGTGRDIKETNLDHIATFQMADGAFVWHLFEVKGY